MLENSKVIKDKKIPFGNRFLRPVQLQAIHL